MPPIVVITGRANVGKSTLFNRLVGRRASIVADSPGVTRDRQEARALLRGRTVVLVDTAGLAESQPDTLAGRMHAGSVHALDQADLILFVVDARTGLTPTDRHFARWLRRQGKPVLLIVNKAEGRSGHASLEAYELGLDEPFAVSAEHGDGISALMSEIADRLPPHTDESDSDLADRPIRLAIVGRPNVGKSALLNRLLGWDRMITGAEQGLTRDAVLVPLSDVEGHRFELVDTPGLRRRSRVEASLERMSVQASIQALKRADVALVVVDATIGVEDQDLQIARLVEREGRAVVIVLNKWDAVADPRVARKAASGRFEASLSQLRGVSMVEVSALMGTGVDHLLPAARNAVGVWNTRISTGALNRWFETALARHQPPLLGSRRLKLRYITQAKARPPTFVVFGTRASDTPEEYRRYLVNSLREELKLPGTPIRINFRSPTNPYVDP